MTSARTSNPELAATLKAIGLECELDEKAPAGADELVAALLDVYSDPSRAEAARVFVSRGEDNAALATVLSRWAQREIPPVGDDFAGEEELVQFVADWLMAKALHGDTASPQLFAFEAEEGLLYLLRTEQELSWSGKSGTTWIPGFDAGTRNSPDTEAALNGIYRGEGCEPAFAEHARSCARCLALFDEHRRRMAELPPDQQHCPEGFEEFLGPTARAPLVPAALPPPRPWWRFW